MRHEGCLAFSKQVFVHYVCTVKVYLQHGFFLQSDLSCFMWQKDGNIIIISRYLNPSVTPLPLFPHDLHGKRADTFWTERMCFSLAKEVFLMLVLLPWALPKIHFSGIHHWQVKQHAIALCDPWWRCLAWRRQLVVHFLREIFRHHKHIPMWYQKTAATFITPNIIMVTKWCIPRKDCRRGEKSSMESVV